MDVDIMTDINITTERHVLQKKDASDLEGPTGVFMLTESLPLEISDGKRRYNSDQGAEADKIRGKGDELRDIKDGDGKEEGCDSQDDNPLDEHMDLVVDSAGDGKDGEPDVQVEKWTVHPVDKGYSWVVMVAVFGLQFVLVGYIKALGVFFVEFQDRFDSSSSMTSIIIGVMELANSLGSPLVMGGLLKVASPRASCLIGSIFLTVGVAGNAWFSRVEFLCLTQGIFFGAAIALQFGPAFVPLTQYFDTRRALATSISTCGASVGGIVFPILCRYLLDEYAFEGGILLTAGVMMQAFVFSALLTPIENYHRNDHQNQTLLNKLRRLFKCRSRLRRSTRDISNTSKASEDEVRLSMLPTTKETNSDGNLPPVHTLTVNKTASSELYTTNAASDGTLQNLNRDDLPGHNEARANSNVLEMGHYRNNGDSKTRSIEKVVVHEHNPNLYGEDTAVKPKSTSLSKQSWFEQCCLRCRQSVLVRSTSFWVLSVFFFCASIGTVLPQTYIPPFAKERGLSDDDGAFFLSIMNILDIPAHLLPGIIVNFGLVSSINICVVPMFIVGVVGLLSPLFLSYWSIMSMSVLYGIFGGIYFVMQPLVVIDTLGQENFPTAIGVYMVFIGMGAAVSYPICGALRDLSGTYSSSFSYLGAMEVTAAAMLILTPFAKRYDVRKGVLASATKTQ